MNIFPNAHSIFHKMALGLEADDQVGDQLRTVNSTLNLYRTSKKTSDFNLLGVGDEGCSFEIPMF